MSSTREVAERIIKDCPRLPLGPYETIPELNLTMLADAIDFTLRQREQEVRAEERERAAGIADAHAGHGGWCGSTKDDCQTATVKAIAAAIRRDDAPQEGEQSK